MTGLLRPAGGGQNIFKINQIHGRTTTNQFVRGYPRIGVKICREQLAELDFFENLTFRGSSHVHVFLSGVLI